MSGLTREEYRQKILEINAILEAGEPDNITTNKQANPPQSGYRPQAVINAMNEVLFGYWGFNELSNELHAGEKSLYAIAHGEIWLEGITFKPTAWGQGRQKSDEANARKAGQTDFIKKAASYYSIGERAYMGLLEVVEEDTEEEEKRRTPMKSNAERMAELKAAKEAAASTTTRQAASSAPVTKSPAPRREPVATVTDPVVAPTPDFQQEQPKVQESPEYAELKALRKPLSKEQKALLTEYCIRTIAGISPDPTQWDTHMTQALAKTKQWLSPMTPKQKTELATYESTIGGAPAINRLSERLFQKASGLLCAGLAAQFLHILHSALFTVNLALQIDLNLGYLGKRYKGAKVPLDLFYNTFEGVSDDPAGEYMEYLITQAKTNPDRLKGEFRLKYAEKLAHLEIPNLIPEGHDADPTSVASHTL